MEVSFTHAKTGTLFGGNISLVNVQYRRKLTAFFPPEDIIYYDANKNFYILNFPIASERVILVIKGIDLGWFSKSWEGKP